MRKFSFLRKSPDCVSVFILLYSIEEIRKGGFFRMNITVYLGANEGSDTSFRQAVEELGRWIGESGHALVYGGSKSGLMGALAASALAVTPLIAAAAATFRKPLREIFFIWNAPCSFFFRRFQAENRSSER
jgi:hypothetical protein